MDMVASCDAYLGYASTVVVKKNQDSLQGSAKVFNVEIIQMPPMIQNIFLPHLSRQVAGCEC